MRNLIIDESLLEQVAKLLPGSPIYSTPEGKMLAPGIINLLEENLDSGSPPWFPADSRTKHLVLGGEACQSFLFNADRFMAPETRARAMKSMGVDICALMDQLKALLPKFDNEQSQKERLTWPQVDQKTYSEISESLKEDGFQGSVRYARNKLGAHLDKAVFDKNVVPTVKDFLKTVGDSLLLLYLMLNHETACIWTRCVGSTSDGQYDLVEQMISWPVATRWLVNLEGRPVGIFPLTIAKDPRMDIQEPLLKAVGVYNKMVKATNTTLPEIWVRSTKKLLESEKRANSLGGNTA